MLQSGREISRGQIRIDQEKIVRHTTEFPNLVNIVLASYETHVDIDLMMSDERNGTIRSYKPTLSPYMDHENLGDREDHIMKYQRQFEAAKETARREYEKILKKVEEGKYILHLYDDGRVDLELT